MNEPDFLTIDDVLAVHARSMELFGGAAGIRDQGLLESAVAAPQAAFGGEFAHATIFEMAAAYAFHIAQNQPFIDGNKRTGLGSALVFLSLNGFEVEDPSGELYDVMIAMAERRMDKRAAGVVFKRLSAAL